MQRSRRRRRRKQEIGAILHRETAKGLLINGSRMTNDLIEGSLSGNNGENFRSLSHVRAIGRKSKKN